MNYCRGWLDVPISIAEDGDYILEVVAFQKAAGDESARLEIMVESDSDSSQGALAVRRKLVELYDRLLGVTETVDSPEVEAAFRLFVDVWNQKRIDADGIGFFWGEEECTVGSDRLFLSEVGGRGAPHVRRARELPNSTGTFLMRSDAAVRSRIRTTSPGRGQSS